MGFFGKLAFSDGTWTAGRPTAVPFLLVDVHDSDVATVDYRSADASGGRFFLGYEPRFYFDEPAAADPVDVSAEAEGFVRWVREVTGSDVDPSHVAALMAAPDGTPPHDDVVEDAVERLVELAGLPLPDWPVDDDAPPG